MSGGGIQGVAMLGALKNVDVSAVTHIAGTSVGAIIGALMCTCSVNDIIDLARGVKMYEESALDLHNVFEFYGVIDPTYILDKISDVFEVRTGKRHPTFADLLHFSRINLIITGTNLTTQTGELFSADTTPDMQIITALEITLSIPFIFKKVIYDGCIYADGGIMHMYPHDAFGTIDTNDIICIYCEYGTCIKDDTFMDYVASIVSSIITCQKRSIVNAVIDTILIRSEGTSIFEDLDNSTFELLLQKGSSSFISSLQSRTSFALNLGQ